MNNNEFTYPKTPEDVRAYLCAHGISLKQWSDVNGFSYSMVKDVMYGRLKGNHGTSHHVAVALGFKPQPETSMVV